MLTEMAKIQIVGLRDVLDQVICHLYHLQILHFEEIDPGVSKNIKPIALSEKEQEKKNQIHLLRVELTGVIDLIGSSTDILPITSFEHLEFAEIKRDIEKCIEQVKRLLEKKKAVEEEMESLPIYEARIKELIPILPEAAYDQSNMTFGLLISQYHIDVLEILHEQLAQITRGNFHIVSSDIDDSTKAMVLIAPRNCFNEIELLLGDENIPRWQMPPQIKQHEPLSAVSAIQSRIKELPDEMKQIDLELQEFSDNWMLQILQWQEMLQAKFDSIEIKEMIRQSNFMFIIHGWLPKDQYKQFEQAMEEKFGDQIQIDVLSLSQDDLKNAPVEIKNSAVVKAFQRPVKMFSTPGYFDIDPTRWISFFFPLFFGMILGDIGYGIILLGLSLLLMKRFEKGVVKDLLQIILYSAGWTIIFGFLFGELFGTLGEHLGLHPIWMDRADSHSLIPLLVASISMGLVHIVVGLILGISQAVRSNSRHQLLERGGMLIGIIGLLILGGVFLEYLPEFLTYPSVFILVFGIAVLGISFGKAGIVVGPIEFIGVIGNILSYIRIAAIGLSSVYLAKVANDIAGMLGSIIVGLIVAILFHALNLIIGTFSPSIHSLRLQYVEFFRKFYSGGGKPYHPFGQKLVDQ
jgi:V/A-type H+-transporting ATPase subunit I